jgi:hypothetical protein
MLTAIDLDQLAVPGQQPLCLPHAHVQHYRRRIRRAFAGQYLSQDLDPLQMLARSSSEE